MPPLRPDWIYGNSDFYTDISRYINAACLGVVSAISISYSRFYIAGNKRIAVSSRDAAKRRASPGGKEMKSQGAW